MAKSKKTQDKEEEEPSSAAHARGSASGPAGSAVQAHDCRCARIEDGGHRRAGRGAAVQRHQSLGVRSASSTTAPPEGRPTSRPIQPPPAARSARQTHRTKWVAARHLLASTRPSRRSIACASIRAGSALTTNLGVPIGDNQNSLKAGLRGPTLLEDFILREKITHFDHERIPERIVHARGFGRARLLRMLQVDEELHARVGLRRGRQADTGVRPLLDRRRRARLDRHRARCPRLRREVLHRRGQLGPRRQQHPGVLHPGCDEVPRPRARGEARAASRACRRRRRRTTRSGTSCR